MNSSLFAVFRMSSLCLSLTLVGGILAQTALSAPAPTAAMALAAEASSSEALAKITRAMGSEKSSTQLRIFMRKLGLDEQSVEKAMRDPVSAQQALVARLKAQQANPALQKEAASILGLNQRFSKAPMEASRVAKPTGPSKGEVSDALAESKGTGKLSLTKEGATKAGAPAPAQSKANAFLAKVDELTQRGDVDSLINAQLKLAVINHPARVANIIGDGFFTSCGALAKSKVAGANYFDTVIEGAKAAKTADAAIAIKRSFIRNTGASESVAKADICKLSGPPCNLYNSKGPAALNCK